MPGGSKTRPYHLDRLWKFSQNLYTFGSVRPSFTLVPPYRVGKIEYAGTLPRVLLLVL